MKILQISAAYKPAFIYGGPTMSVSMLAEQLVKAGVMVSVFTTTANGKDELEVVTGWPLTVDGVETTYFKRLTKDHTHFSPALLMSVWRNAKNFDAIHIHAWWNTPSVLACLIAVIRRVPVIVSPRGTLSDYSFSNKNNNIKGLIHRYVTIPLLKKCYLHTTSANEYSAMKALLQTKTVFNIPNFIRLADNNNYTPVPVATYLKLIFLSRIEEKKGLDILLKALTTLTILYKLTIAGDGDADYVQSLKHFAIKNNIDRHIDWIGFQSDNKFGLLHQHDLLVLPSHNENFGNVVIESLSVGTAVLISEQVGLAGYVTDTHTGWICQTNAASVSQAIYKISEQPEELKRIRRTAPDIILRDFDNNNLVKKYIDMYNQIITNERV